MSADRTTGGGPPMSHVVGRQTSAGALERQLDDASARVRAGAALAVAHVAPEDRVGRTDRCSLFTCPQLPFSLQSKVLSEIDDLLSVI